MASSNGPQDRNKFQIAIICALAIEYDAVEALFDETWDNIGYGKADGDPNSYSMGQIGLHPVVLVLLPRMGITSAASAAAAIRLSFTGIRLGLVVGICGAVPFTSDGDEIVLGDMIISTVVITYDFGRQTPNKIARKTTIEENPGRPNNEIQSVLEMLKTLKGRKSFMANASSYLEHLCTIEELSARYLGQENDLLFESDYCHKHRYPRRCAICAQNTPDPDSSCEESSHLACATVGCDIGKIIERTRLTTTTKSNAFDGPKPRLHLGRMASGNSVMRSAKHRDEISRNEGVIAFEMEGAGVWDNFPTIIIKGVCDYADSHKNKEWQRYAAASAASAAKALLKMWYPQSSTFASSQNNKGELAASPNDRSSSREESIKIQTGDIRTSEHGKVGIYGVVNTHNFSF